MIGNHYIWVTMKTFILLLLLGTVVLFVCSCQRVYYAPTGQNIPLFKDKNEFRFSATRSTGGDLEGIEVQGAFSPLKNLGVTGNYFELLNYKKGYGRYYALGAGYYYPHKDFVFEVYGGYGNGKSVNEFDDDYIRSNFNKLYIQPSIGFSNKYFDFILGAQYSRVSQYNISASDSSYKIIEITQELEMLDRDKTHYFLEPSITIRAGYKYVKLQAQLCFIPNAFSPGYPIDNTQLNFGLFFSLPHKKNK